MPLDALSPLLLGLLFCATAIGFFLGKKDPLKSKAAADAATERKLSAAYYAGLDLLLNDQHDEAMESFLHAIEINSDSIPAHLALAKVCRKKGDVEKAIKIHQNLLARPGLSKDEFHRIQLALARDYLAVGLFDRAENILEKLVEQHLSHRLNDKAIRMLLGLYEKQYEWSKAVALGGRLSHTSRQSLATELAHYCCEIAEDHLAGGEYDEARAMLKRADDFSPKQVRSLFLFADIAMATQQWRQAIKYLKQVASRDPVMFTEALPKLVHCYERLGNTQQLHTYLEEMMVENPSTSVMLSLAQQIEQQAGMRASATYITEELKKRPSVKGFNRLIDLHIKHGNDSAKSSLEVLRGLTGQLELSKPVYCCNNCGFSAKNLVWQCPSCKKWESTKPIQGLEGE